MKLTAAQTVLLVAGALAVVILVGSFVLAARGVDVPSWIGGGFGTLLAFLTGWAARSPFDKGVPK